MPPFIRQLHEIDQSITLAINDLHSAFLDQVAIFLSDIKVWIPFYIIVGAIFVKKFGWKRGAVIIISLGLTFALTDQLTNLVKDCVSRLRPCYNTYMLDGGLRILEKRGGLYGFYSAHAANAFGFALCSIVCLKMDRTKRYPFFSVLVLSWATLVAFSRILIGKHYFGDVVVGTVMGIIIGTALALLARAVISRYIKTESC